MLGIPYYFKYMKKVKFSHEKIREIMPWWGENKWFCKYMVKNGFYPWNFYKYIDGVTACFREVKSILLRNNLLDKEIESGIRSTVFYMIRHKICTLRDKSFFSLRKVIKYTINKQDIKEMMKNTRISELDFKHKFIIILLKLHFYSIIVAYIKNIKNKKNTVYELEVCND